MPIDKGSSLYSIRLIALCDEKLRLSTQFLSSSVIEKCEQNDDGNRDAK